MVIPLGAPPTLFVKDLRLRTYAALLSNKSKNNFGLIISIFFRILVFGFEGVIGTIRLRCIEISLSNMRHLGQSVS